MHHVRGADVLLAIGATRLLIWNGDILTGYVIEAFSFPLFRELVRVCELQPPMNEPVKLRHRQFQSRPRQLQLYRSPFPGTTRDRESSAMCGGNALGDRES